MKRIPKPDALARLADERGAGCRMCELAADGEVLASSPHAVALLDRYAARPGHALVVLRRHEERLTALAVDEWLDLSRLAWLVGGALEAVLSARRVYVAALGSAVPLATSFPHVHLHVIPLADGGEADRPADVFTWQHGVYVFEDLAEERALGARVRAALR